MGLILKFLSITLLTVEYWRRQRPPRADFDCAAKNPVYAGLIQIPCNCPGRPKIVRDLLRINVAPDEVRHHRGAIALSGADETP